MLTTHLAPLASQRASRRYGPAYDQRPSGSPRGYFGRRRARGIGRGAAPTAGVVGPPTDAAPVRLTVVRADTRSHTSSDEILAMRAKMATSTTFQRDLDVSFSTPHRMLIEGIPLRLPAIAPTQQPSTLFISSMLLIAEHRPAEIDPTDD